MKRCMLLVSAVILLAMIHTAGWTQGKYIPKATEEMYGTWINKHGAPTKSVSFAGGFKNYVVVAGADRIFNEGTEEIESKWKDAEGNLWYKSYGTITSGTWAGMKFQTLLRISKSGTVREWVNSLVIDFDPKSYPPKIDSEDPDYKIFTRASD
jgi:hypothetical protein